MEGEEGEERAKQAQVGRGGSGWERELGVGEVTALGVQPSSVTH